MSIMDDVAALRELAGTIPNAIIRQAQQTLLEMNAKLTGILGPNFGTHADLQQKANTAGIRLESAMQASRAFEDAINDVADALAGKIS